MYKQKLFDNKSLPFLYKTKNEYLRKKSQLIGCFYNTWKKIPLSYKITNYDLETVNYYDNYTFLQKYSAELGSLVSDFQVKGSCAQGGARKMVLKFSQKIITF